MRIIERPAAITAMLLTAGAVLLACAGGRPAGPVFEPLAPPDASSTLVYIYRLDTLRGVGGARVKLDGERIATLRNGEYVAFVVDPGRHEIRASILWLGLLARSWNGIELRTDGGETVYVRIWADTEEGPPAPAGAEIPGRPDRKADAGLFMGLVSPSDARVELRAMRRAELD
jgi:hypothetical protein